MGENGVGKELVARAIHEASGRKGPFVPVALSAIPQDLVESELFGHEKGAFTGAISRRIGRFELASHGTIFLDEVGEIPPSLQVKLLRVLQEGEYQRLGSSPTLKTHARVIAATNQDLPSKIKKGEFREDLYYRLNVFPIYLPPLRERKEDIPLLVEHFIKKYNPRLGREVVDVSQEAMDILMEYEWPGNIRELENIVQRAMIISEKRVIGKEAILTKHPKHPIEKRGFEGAVEDLISSYEPSCKRTLWDLTLSTLVRQAISRTQNKEEAAKLLGISRPTLYHWLRKGLT
jgi:transcriptional regulator with GAF, ATPase, and Fis domain